MPVTTGKVRFSYVHVWAPYAAQPGQEAKYSVTILVPKTDVATLNAIYAEVEAAKQYGIPNVWGGKLPPVVKIPIYDGDGVRPSGEPFGEECHGCMVFTASSKSQPQVVDTAIQPILNQAEVYSGCYGLVNVNFYAYAHAGNKGIGCGLNCLQKLEDGEALSGGISAAEAFGGKNAYRSVQQFQLPAQPQSQQQFQFPAQSQAQQQYQMPAQAPIQQAPYQMPQQQYQMPQFQAPVQQIDPITGRPLLSGGIMGV